MLFPTSTVDATNLSIDSFQPRLEAGPGVWGGDPCAPSSETKQTAGEGAGTDGAALVAPISKIRFVAQTARNSDTSCLCRADVRMEGGVQRAPPVDPRSATAHNSTVEPLAPAVQVNPMHCVCLHLLRDFRGGWWGTKKRGRD